jgi:hypothetical protein
VDTKDSASKLLIPNYLVIFAAYQAQQWALVGRKIKQFFLVLIYLFLVAKDSGEWMKSSKDFFSLTPAAMQYKTKREDVNMRKTIKTAKMKKMKREHGSRTASTLRHRPESYSI